MIRLTTAALALTALGAAAAVLRPAQELPTASEHHAYLMRGVGEWEGTMTMHAEGMSPEGVPCHDSITAVGDFWTRSSFSCDLMGMPFVGTGVTGYDPDKGKFVGTWVDNMTTRLTVMEGELEGDALVMRYVGPDPVTGEPAPHRIVGTNDGETSTSTFYVGEGEGVKTMTIAMKRVKAKRGK